MTMSGTCHICDNSNVLERFRFVGFRRMEPVFSLTCESCGMVTEVDAKGDLWKSEVYFGG